MESGKEQCQSKSAQKATFTKKLKELKNKFRESGIDESVIHRKVVEQLTVNDVCDVKRDKKNSGIWPGLWLWWKSSGSGKRRWIWRLFFPAVMVASLAVLLGPGELGAELGEMVEDIVGARCLVDNNIFLTEAARPLMECGKCSGLTEFPVHSDLTRQEFAEKYAYQGIPVLVKNATQEWSAMRKFTFNYFKKTYEETEDALETIEEECQFFPYETEEVNSLGELFNMSAERVTFEPGQKNWYIGWSNCHGGVAAELRQHYQRPYFLPQDSESSQIDWIFMGGSGPGADLHLDYVERPSWQAQISGTKTWTLVPVPECEAVCHTLNVTVHKGDIIVLDTNQWYHSTFIHPGELSITIGSEYD